MTQPDEKAEGTGRADEAQRGAEPPTGERPAPNDEVTRPMSLAELLDNDD